MEYEIVTFLSVLLFLLVMGMLTGKGLLQSNPYNSYALQADSWRQGRLDLGQDYSWLELAIFDGKYYVSFPPFPSYVLFPLTFLFGSNTPDYFILLLVDMVSAIYLYRIAVRVGMTARGAMVGTLLTLLGSNMVFIMIDPSVWFIAQTMCFMTAVLAIYFALSGKGAAALFFWACSVGCRPMQAVFLPVLLYILYQGERSRFPGEPVWKMLKKRVWWGVPTCVVAFSYMLLNYLRFGNILEFGHNYLPEFVRSEHGQFHISYIKDNVLSLFRLPEFSEDGKMLINSMGNLSMLVISPIVVVFLAELLFALFKREWRLAAELAGLLVLTAVYLLVVVMHKTMGGWHFGNRYSNDILPWIYFGTVLVHRKFPGLVKYQVPLLAAAYGLNLVGSIAVYNRWI